MGGSSEFEGCIVNGPWGGSNGDKWVYMPQGIIKKMKISVRYGDVIDSINFQTYYRTGESESFFFGGNGGDRTDTICIDSRDEYLISISGTTGDFDGSTVVKSIRFKTSQNRYGPFGSSSGTAFSYDGKGGVVVGFHGRADNFLDAIGVYVRPQSLAYDCKLIPQPQLSSTMSSKATPRDGGPWGADGGKPWDDGVFSSIKQIRVHMGGLNVIYALQFEYLKNDGKTILSQIHGGTDGVNNIELVNFDEKDEFLLGISGFYGAVKGSNGLEAISSISFRTNKKIHGPYGEERGARFTYFGSKISAGKVVGFHGRENGFLSKIGVHMEYF